MENFVGDFSDLNWDKLKDPCVDVDAKFTFFHDQLSKCVRRLVPLTRSVRRLCPSETNHGLHLKYKE